MPCVRASTPAPLAAEPQKTGWTSARRVCSARGSGDGRSESADSSRTYSLSTASSRSARTSARRDRRAGSVAIPGLKVALRGPASRTVPIATMPVESRRDIASRTRPTSAPARSILLTKIRVGTPMPAESPHEQRRLGLDAFDRGDDEDGAVEHAEDALDLGDEVGVAGRVDDVDREVADDERGDRGPDRDAAFALEVEGVGLGGAGVDAADVVDGAGGVEESLGESGLTGVDVREDSEIERTHGASCLPRRSSSPSGWT